MALKKCPRCELNYCRKNEEYCDVCLRELSRTNKNVENEENDEIIMCFECGEKPAAPGHDLCIDCLKEQKHQQELGDDSEGRLDPYDDEDDLEDNED